MFWIVRGLLLAMQTRGDEWLSSQGALLQSLL